jgi:putative hydrolase of the HAD superfamily
MPSRITAVFFDLDETLIPDEPAFEEALHETCGEVEKAHGVPREKLAQGVELAGRRLWKEFDAERGLARRLGISATEGLWGKFETGENPNIKALCAFAPGYRKRAWHEALREHGVDDAALAGRLAGRFMEARRKPARCAPFPDSRPALEALKKRFRLGAISNGAVDLQREKFAASGLEKFFEAIVISAELDVGKPKAGIFEAAMKKLDSAPAGSVMVGDSLVRDIAGARGVGMKAVWVNRFGKTVPDGEPIRPTERELKRQKPDLEISDLSPLPSWLGV